jgi:phosphoribosylformylglycinamidine synthase
MKSGTPPPCDLEVAATLHHTLVGLIRAGGIKSAHDCNDGGLTVALAECCISRHDARHTPRLIGAVIDLTSIEPSSAGLDQVTDDGPEKQLDESPPGPLRVRLDALLFGESHSRVVVTCSDVDATKILERARLMGVPATRLGTVGGTDLALHTRAGDFTWPVKELHELWWNAIARVMH